MSLGIARVALAALLCLPLLLAGLLSAFAEEREATARLASGKSRGPIKVRVIDGGVSVVTRQNAAPGDVAKGRVRVVNAGTEDARFTLSKRRVVSTPGLYGGDLADTLILRVKRMPGPMRPRPAAILYEGPLRLMPTLRLGRWEPGWTRQYTFRLLFPETGLPPSPDLGDNAYQGARVSFDFVWRAVG